MNLFRENILDNREHFLSITQPLLSDFNLEGESYKRPLLKEPQALANWYNRKSFALIYDGKETETLFDDQLPGLLQAGFERLAPLYHFLMEIETQKRRTILN